MMGDCEGPGAGDRDSFMFTRGRKDCLRLFLATVLVNLLAMASSSWLISSRFSSTTASILGEMTVSSSFITLSSIRVLSSRMFVKSKTFLVGAGSGDAGTPSSSSTSSWPGPEAEEVLEDPVFVLQGLLRLGARLLLRH